MTTPYSRAMDPFPLESADHTKLHEFYARLGQGSLVTTRCLGCGTRAWPPRGFCGECTSDDYEWVDLPTEGVIHAFTTQDTGLPSGFDGPRTFAVVKVAADVRIFSIVTGATPTTMKMGARVRLSPMRVTDDPKDTPRWLVAFELAP
jgi:uncharacterized OB-fold protein